MTPTSVARSVVRSDGSLLAPARVMVRRRARQEESPIDIRQSRRMAAGARLNVISLILGGDETGLSMRVALAAWYIGVRERACGAVGSALPWHGRGREFESHQVHQPKPQ